MHPHTTFNATEQSMVELCNLNMSNLGAIHHLQFDRKWIFTIPWPLRTQSALSCEK